MAAVTSAVIAGVGVAGSIKSGRDAKKAAERGTQAQERAAQENTALQREMWERGEQKSQPFYETGVAANSMLAQMLGLGGAQQAAPAAPGNPMAPTIPPTAGPTGGVYRGTEVENFRRNGIMQFPEGQVSGYGPTANTGGPAQVFGGATQPQAAAQTPEQQRQAAFDLWRGTPGYQFNLDEGRKQYESGAAARGGLLSGKAGKDLLKLGQNYADRTYGDYMNALRSQAGQAQVANSQSLQAGQNFANQAGANMTNAANARASGLQAGANATSNMWGNIAGIGGWLAGQYGGNGMAGSPSTGFASGFGNNTGWLSGGSGFNNSPGGGGFSWLGGGG